MKFLILAIFFLLPGVVRAQARWSKIKLGQFITVARVAFADSEVGYVLCSEPFYPHSEILFRTSDGGSSWAKTYIDTSKDTTLRVSALNQPNLFAPTRRDIYVGGSSGTSTIYYSSDSGSTWVQRGGGTNLFMYSASSGYAQDPLQHIMKTEDSAKTWCCQLKYYAQYVDWSDSLHGMAGLLDTEDAQGIYHTIEGFYGWGTADGGQDWTFHSVGLPSGLYSNAAAVPNSNTFYFYQAVAPNSAYSTTDLGATWQIDTMFPGRIATMTFWGSERCIALSSGDTLTRYHPSEWLALSSDGSHWDIDSTSAKGLNITAIEFTDATHGWAIGNDTSTAGLPFKDSTTAYVLKYLGPPLDVNPAAAASRPPELELSPNPAQTTLHFILPVSQPVMKTEAVNELGAATPCALRPTGGGEGEVDISSLPAGVYELRVWTRDGSYAQPFVKMP